MRRIATLSLLCLTLACSDDDDAQPVSDAGTEADGRAGGDGASTDGMPSDGESQDGSASDGSDGDVGVTCEALGVDRCLEHDRCALTELKPWNEDRGCWSEAVPAGCLPIDGGCTSEVSCWLDPDGQRWLKGGCPPVGWTVTPCDGYTDCE